LPLEIGSLHGIRPHCGKGGSVSHGFRDLRTPAVSVGESPETSAILPGVPEPRPQAVTDVSHPPEATEERCFVCDLCGKTFSGLPEGSGLFMWTRGNEVRVEEPPLCRGCASRLVLGAFHVYEDGSGEE